jgi:integrase
MTGTCIVKRGKRFAVQVYLGRDPQNPKRRRTKWYHGFATRREADVFRATLAYHPVHAAGVGIYGSTRLRTGDYLTDWLRTHAETARLEAKTVERYEQFIRVHIVPILGHIPIARLSPPSIQAAYTTLLDGRLSHTSVRHVANLLHKALADAVRRGIIAGNPTDQTDPPMRDTTGRPVLTPPQVHRYLADARATAPIYLWALYVTKAGTGMRFGELLGLREVDLDLDHGVMTLEQSLKRPGPAPMFGRLKTERSRRPITLPSEVADALRSLRRWKIEQKLKCGPMFREYGLVFCGPSGAPLHQNNIRYRDHYPRLARLGLPRIRPHDLRHGHATYLIAQGVDPRTVADRLGHSSPSFTMQTYVHGVPESARRAAEIASTLLVPLESSEAAP